MIIVKKNISVYDEINRSIVKRKRKYGKGGIQCILYFEDIHKREFHIKY